MLTYAIYRDASNNIYAEPLWGVRVNTTKEQKVKLALKRMKQLNKGLKDEYKYMELLDVIIHEKFHDCISQFDWEDKIARDYM